MCLDPEPALGLGANFLFQSFELLAKFESLVTFHDFDRRDCTLRVKMHNLFFGKLFGHGVLRSHGPMAMA